MTITELNEQNFATEVLQSPTPVLVDFWAPWCGPCKIMGPILDEIAAGWSGKPLKIGKLNVDEAPSVGGKYQILSIPTFLLFKNGVVAAHWRGVQDKASWQKAIEASL